MAENNSTALRQVIMSRSNMTQFIESPTQQFPTKHSTNVETISPVELYVVIALLAAMSVIGTAGNLCVMCVYFKKKENLVSNHFIIVLAVVDFTTCLVIIPYTIFMEYVEYYVTSDLCCKFYHFLITSNIPFSAWIMVAIAVDRYLCICHPFQRVMTMNRAKALSVTLAMFTCLLGVFVALIHGVYQIQQPNNSTSTEALIPVSTFAMEPMESMLESTTLNQDWTSLSISTISPSSDQPVWVNLGLCQINDIYISATFQWYYHRFFLAMYPFCLFVVVVLYILIFRSVRARRCLRQEQKSKSLALVQSLMNRTKRASAPTNSLTQDNLIEAAAATPATTPNGDQPTISKGIATVAAHQHPLIGQHGQQQQQQGQKSQLQRRSSKVDNVLLANLKTAAMLFVVTVVFVVTFAPAFFMAMRVVPENVIVFYLYFANNVANPVIYSFMNRNFRADLAKLFCQRDMERQKSRRGGEVRICKAGRDLREI